MYRVRMSSTRLKFVPIAICLAFGLAACGDDAKSTATSTTVAEAIDTTAGPVEGAPSDVMLSDSTFGPILTDGAGNTLYMYAPDSPDAATCNIGCSGAWPPYFFDGTPSVGEGLNLDLFTTVPSEGGSQLAYNGHPLYFFGGDSGPGDTNGQGSGGLWFVLDAEGNQISA